MKQLIFTSIAVLLAVLATSLSMTGLSPADTEPLFQFPQSHLSIRTASGRVLHFNVWLADNPRRQEQGLMFVRDLEEHAGMMFVYPGSQRLTMWMKDTYIPLDMLFIDAQGPIDYIAPRAKPLSLDIISAPRPANAVIELKGGTVQRLGIHVGDLIVPETGVADHPAVPK